MTIEHTESVFGDDPAKSAGFPNMEIADEPSSKATSSKATSSEATSSEAPSSKTPIPANEPVSETPDTALPDADTEVFNRFLAGNDEAFRALYDAYERPLYLYIIRLLGSQRDSEDLFQEVWTRMYRLRGEQMEVRKFSGLLFTVARNLSINAIRDRNLHPEVSFEDTGMDDSFGGRVGNVEASDLRDMLERALLQIPVAQREAFILREYFGYSYEEVGQITGTEMVTSKTRAWRAREGLRKVISAWLELKNTDHKIL